MARTRRKRYSDLYWELVDGEEPTPTPEELAELKDALLDEAKPVRDTLKYAVKILRRDTARLNAALEESDEEREARLEKQREYKRAYRARMSEVSELSEVSENGQNGQNGQMSTSVQSVRTVQPTDQRPHLLTNKLKPKDPSVPSDAREGALPPDRRNPAGPSVDKSSRRKYTIEPPANANDIDYETVGDKRIDPVLIAVRLCGCSDPRERMAFGAIMRSIGEATFRAHLESFVGELKAGEEPRSRVAALLSRFRAVENGGVA